MCGVVIYFRYFIPCAEFKIFQILHMIMFLLRSAINTWSYPELKMHSAKTGGRKPERAEAKQGKRERGRVKKKEKESK